MAPLLYISSGLAIVLAAYLATGSTLPVAPRRLLSAALLAVAALNLLALLQIEGSGYALVSLRPALATVLPMLLFLHVVTATRRKQALRPGDALHLFALLPVLFFLLSPGARAYLDAYIIGISIFYLVLIARVSWEGPQSFNSLGTRLAVLFDRWRKLVLVFLFVSTLLDASIMMELGGDGAALRQSSMIGISSILLVLGFSYLLIAGLHGKGPLIWAETSVRNPLPEHVELIERLEARLVSTQAFLDPGLTIQRFARQSGESSRDVSIAINELGQCNFNQWLNGFRTAEARRIMREDPNRSISDVMFAAGFQNKSTFNAVFKAMEGVSPGQWRDRQLGHEKR